MELLTIIVAIVCIIICAFLALVFAAVFEETNKSFPLLLYIVAIFVIVIISFGLGHSYAS